MEWKEAFEALINSADPELHRKLLGLLHQEISEGRLSDPSFLEHSRDLYNKVKDPWLSGELKRLQNRFRSRQVLGSDLLRLATPPMEDEERLKLWEDLKSLKAAYDGIHGRPDDFEAKYDVREKIGDGGMSVVFRALSRVDGTEVAIKCLLKEYLHTPSMVARFQRECRLCLSFDHPNIAKVYEMGEHQGVGFMVMEYLPLGGIDAFLGHPDLNACLALSVIRQAAEALAYIHTKNIVHRDVKLSNLLVSDWSPQSESGKNGRVQIKLADFGLSKELSGEGLTAAGTKLGTDFYIAPEQRESPQDVDTRADIYSLGVALYRLVSVKGFPEGDYPSLHELCPELSPELDDLLNKCLKVNREERYSSAGNLAQELGRFEKEMCERRSDAL